MVGHIPPPQRCPGTAPTSAVPTGARPKPPPGAGRGGPPGRVRPRSPAPPRLPPTGPLGSRDPPAGGARAAAPPGRPARPWPGGAARQTGAAGPAAGRLETGWQRSRDSPVVGPQRLKGLDCEDYRRRSVHTLPLHPLTAPVKRDATDRPARKIGTWLVPSLRDPKGAPDGYQRRL